MRALKHIIIWTLILALLGGAVWYFLIYNPALTSEILAEQAALAADREQYDKAVMLYGWASSLQKGNQQLSLELAQVYKSQGNYTKAEYTLAGAIATGGSLEVYLELCRTYVEQDKLLDAVTMLDKVADEKIRAQLDAMRPQAPVASLEPGFYTQYLDVDLSAEGGTVYVSTSWEYPSLSTPYEMAISLGQGETAISALTVSEDGLVSPLSVFRYTVEGVVEQVVLEDANLDSYLREILSRSPDSPFTTADLWGITEMTIPEDVTKFSQMAYFTGLTSLTIRNQSALDISFLEAMPKLTKLDLSGCTLDAEQLGYIAGLGALTDLNLSGCRLSTIAGLSGMTSLKKLDLSVNSISDLLPLISNTGLEWLDLSHNAVVNFSAMTGTTSLTWLNLSNNSLSDLTAVATCSNLGHLNVSTNVLTTLNGISGLKELTFLDASYNAIADIAGIGQCSKLTELNLSNNKLVTMDEMATLVLLEQLDVSYNDILTIPDFPDHAALVSFNGCHNFFEDVSGLAGLMRLNYVYLDYNNVTDINVLASCFNLIQVNVFRTNVTDISALQEMDVIVSYNPT